jgi:hypothetical protein
MTVLNRTLPVGGDYAVPPGQDKATDFAGSVARTGAFAAAIIEWGPSERPPIGSADLDWNPVAEMLVDMGACWPLLCDPGSIPVMRRRVP